MVVERGTAVASNWFPLGWASLGFSILIAGGWRLDLTKARSRALTDWDPECGWAVGVLVKCPLAVASELGILCRIIFAVSRGN
jgi:hypothetical protein